MSASVNNADRVVPTTQGCVEDVILATQWCSDVHIQAKQRLDSVWASQRRAHGVFHSKNQPSSDVYAREQSVQCGNFGQSTEVTSGVLPAVEESLSDISGRPNLSKNGGFRPFIGSSQRPYFHQRPHEDSTPSCPQPSTSNKFASSLCDPTSEYLTATQELSSREQHHAAQSMDKLRMENNTVYSLLLELADIFMDCIPEELPKDRGTRHEIDLMPGTKYCVTRQWPLPRDQVETIDSFFVKRQESKSCA
uniref:Putative polyprotein n=1 Tax=Albugo laibachii Nc14 TaxID=890382 RepID=F0WRW2_9STRA|nr:putative polyprotein [Albugo laibachii Nc14]|eukprot:CCA24078.1 putative polyprotein [Albugo laibachii Nc14]